MSPQNESNIVRQSTNTTVNNQQRPEITNAESLNRPSFLTIQCYEEDVEVLNSKMEDMVTELN